MAKSKKNVIYKNLDKIIELKKLGVSDEQIFRQLKIAKSTWYKYLNEDENLSNAIKDGAISFCCDLRSELSKQCFKHTLQTKKTWIRTEAETGKKIQYTEITEKEVDGNLGAIHLLLKNIDRDNWSNDWQSIDLKKQELELKKMVAENNAF